MIKKIEIIPEPSPHAIVGTWYEEIREIQRKINEIIEVLNRSMEENND